MGIWTWLARDAWLTQIFEDVRGLYRRAADAGQVVTLRRF